MPEIEVASAAVPVIYITDLSDDFFDPADLFDLAFLLRAPEYDLRGIVVHDLEDASSLLDALTERTKSDVPYYAGQDGLATALQEASAPVNVVVVGAYPIVAELLTANRALFREKVARLFVVGGHINDYSTGSLATERLPIDPRLRERNPERYQVTGDPRTVHHKIALSQLITSGEGVIYLPRDICLWRYAAPGILSDGGSVCEFLLRELFYANLSANQGDREKRDHLAAADTSVLLSSLPALLLAAYPDTSVWLRLFRALPARITTDSEGAITSLETKVENPNLYIVIAIDGQSLGKRLTDRLRDRPLTL